MYRREFQKTSSTVKSLCQFYLMRGCLETNIVVRPFREYCMIRVSGQMEINEREVKEIDGLLNQPKTSEMEYYYDDLLDSDFDDNELRMLGLMVDKAEVKYQDGILVIEVLRLFGKKE